MTRWIAASVGALAFTLGLGLATPYGNQAMADGIEAAPVYQPVYSRKRCLPPRKRWSWRMASPWVCSAEEKCCYDYVLRKGTCLAANQRCF